MRAKFWEPTCPIFTGSVTYYDFSLLFTYSAAENQQKINSFTTKSLSWKSWMKLKTEHLCKTTNLICSLTKHLYSLIDVPCNTFTLCTFTSMLVLDVITDFSNLLLFWIFFVVVSILFTYEQCTNCTIIWECAQLSCIIRLLYMWPSLWK